MKTLRFAVAIAVACVACVKVSDDVKATFAEHHPGEVDNFSPGSPHSFAPPDPVLTQAVVVVDASVSDAVGICPRDVSASSSSSSSLDAGAPTSTPSNCLQDAGNP